MFVWVIVVAPLAQAIFLRQCHMIYKVIRPSFGPKGLPATSRSMGSVVTESDWEENWFIGVGSRSAGMHS